MNPPENTNTNRQQEQKEKAEKLVAPNQLQQKVAEEQGKAKQAVEKLANEHTTLFLDLCAKRGINFPAAQRAVLPTLFRALPDVPHLRRNATPALQKQHAALTQRLNQLKPVHDTAEFIQDFLVNPPQDARDEKVFRQNVEDLQKQLATEPTYASLLELFEKERAQFVADQLAPAEVIVENTAVNTLREVLGLQNVLSPQEFQAVINDLYSAPPPHPSLLPRGRLSRPLPEDPTARAAEEGIRNTVRRQWLNLYGSSADFVDFHNLGENATAEQIGKQIPNYHILKLRGNLEEEFLSRIRAGVAIAPNDPAVRDFREQFSNFYIARQEYTQLLYGNTAQAQPHYWERLGHGIAFVAVRNYIDPHLPGASLVPERMLHLSPEALAKATKEVNERIARLGLQGVTPATVEELAKSLRGNIGAHFLEDLTRHGLADLILFAHMLRSSEDKVKVAEQWITMMAANAYINSRLSLLGSMMLEASLKSPAAARIMLKLARTPVPGLLKLGVALAILVGGHSVIDKIADGVDHLLFSTLGLPGRDQAQWVLGGIQEVTWDMFERGLRNTGGITLNPENDFNMWMRDQSVIAQRVDLPNLRIFNAEGYTYHRTLESWNKQVEFAVKQQKNPILKNLWDLEKIPDTNRWSKRKAAELVRNLVPALGQEREVNGFLKYFPPDKVPSSVNLLSLAVNHEGNARVDRAVENAIAQRGDQAGLRINDLASVIKNDSELDAMLKRREDALKEERRKQGLPEELPADQRLTKESVRIIFNQYLESAKRIAIDVSIYRHLGVYNSNWIGDWQKIGTPEYRRTQFADDGMYFDLEYLARRNNAFSRAFYPNLSNREYAQYLAHAIQWENTLPIAMSSSNGIAADAQEAFNNMFAGNGSHDLNLSPELQKRLSMIDAAQAAGEVLSTEQLQKALQEVRVLAQSRQKANKEEVAKLASQLAGVTLEALNKQSQLTRMSPDMHSRLGLEQNGTFAFTRGGIPPRINSPEVGEIDPVRRSFMFQNGRQMIGESQADALVLEGYGQANGGTIMQMTSFLCVGPRSAWQVRVQRSQTIRYFQRNPYGTNNILVYGTQRLGDVSMPFEQWVKQNPIAASQMEATLQICEKRAEIMRKNAEIEKKKRDAEEAERQRKENEQNFQKIYRAERSPAAFVQTGSSFRERGSGYFVWGSEVQEFRSGDGSRISLIQTEARQQHYKVSSDTPALTTRDAPPPAGRTFDTSTVHRPDPEDMVRIQIRTSTGVQRTINIASYDAYKELSVADQVLVDNILFRPNERGNAALDRIVRLFSHQYTDVGGTFTERRTCISREDLVHRLTPLYLATDGYENKSRFLRSLWDRIVTSGGVVNSTTVDALVEHFSAEAQRKRFGIPPAEILPLSYTFWRSRNSRYIGGQTIQDHGYHEPGWKPLTFGQELRRAFIEKRSIVDPPMGESYYTQWANIFHSRDHLQVPLTAPARPTPAAGPATSLTQPVYYSFVQAVRQGDIAQQIAHSEQLKTHQDLEKRRETLQKSMSAIIARANSGEINYEELRIEYRAIDTSISTLRTEQDAYLTRESNQHRRHALRAALYAALAPRMLEKRLPTLSEESMSSVVWQNPALFKRYKALRLPNLTQMFNAAMQAGEKLPPTASEQELMKVMFAAFDPLDGQIEQYSKELQKFEKEISELRAPTTLVRGSMIGSEQQPMPEQWNYNYEQNHFYGSGAHRPMLFVRGATAADHQAIEQGIQSLTQLSNPELQWSNTRCLYVDCNNGKILLTFASIDASQPAVPGQPPRMKYVQVGIERTTKQDGTEQIRIGVPELVRTVGIPPLSSLQNAIAAAVETQNKADLEAMQQGTLPVAVQAWRAQTRPGQFVRMNMYGREMRVCSIPQSNLLIFLETGPNGRLSMRVHRPTPGQNGGGNGGQGGPRFPGEAVTPPPTAIGDLRGREKQGAQFQKRLSDALIGEFRNFDQTAEMIAATRGSNLVNAAMGRTAEDRQFASEQLAVLEALTTAATQPIDGSFDHCPEFISAVHTNSIPFGSGERLRNHIQLTMRASNNPQEFLGAVSNYLGTFQQKAMTQKQFDTFIEQLQAIEHGQADTSVFGTEIPPGGPVNPA